MSIPLHFLCLWKMSRPVRRWVKSALKKSPNAELYVKYWYYLPAGWLFSSSCARLKLSDLFQSLRKIWPCNRRLAQFIPWLGLRSDRLISLAWGKVSRFILPQPLNTIFVSVCFSHAPSHFQPCGMPNNAITSKGWQTWKKSKHTHQPSFSLIKRFPHNTYDSREFCHLNCRMSVDNLAWNVQSYVRKKLFIYSW